jgi:hypothetical protein
MMLDHFGAETGWIMLGGIGSWQMKQSQSEAVTRSVSLLSLHVMRVTTSAFVHFCT